MSRPTSSAPTLTQSNSASSADPEFPNSIFAISTTFTPPATCTDHHLTLIESLEYEIWFNYPDPVPNTWITDCYPSQYVSSYLAAAALPTPPPANSPFVCPVGYETILSTRGGYIACYSS
jgi:hypothetical protein